MTAATLVTFVPSAPCKRWNFCKANWELCSLITDKLPVALPSPDSRCVDEAYEDFCYSILREAKRSI